LALWNENTGDMKCICCEKQIERLYDDIDDGPKESGMWNDAVVCSVLANYGSRHDGTRFIVAICDSCTAIKQIAGVLLIHPDSK